VGGGGGGGGVFFAPPPGTPLVGLIHHLKTLLANYQPMPHSIIED